LKEREEPTETGGFKVNPTDLLRAIASGALDQNNRPVRLEWGSTQSTLQQVLLLQRLDITEGLMSGINGHLTCVSSRADLPEKSFLALPLSVQMVTDRGQLHAINGIITDVRAGQSDGSLTCYQLTIRDALSVMERRTNSRIFRTKALPDILGVVMQEWRQRSPAFARAFDFDLSGLDRDRYPVREVTRQVNEADAQFVRRLLRRDGVNVFVRAGGGTDATSSNTPVHTLVFFDDPMKLPQAATGDLRFHRDAATEERDSITLWSTTRSLIPGSVKRATPDYKSSTVTQTQQPTVVDQGDAGNDLAQLLSDSVIDAPHAGDSWSDYDRLGKDRMLAHELKAESVDGASGVRDMAVGYWFSLTGHPEVDQRPANQRQFVTTFLHHRAENSLPKELNDRAQALFEASRWVFESPAASSGSTSNDETRYENTFSCIRRGVQLTPAYDPGIDLPPVHPMTATVVGPDGEEVFCDEMGRIRVQIQGLDPDDHSHAQGAGASGTPADSAPVRVTCALAGPSFGESTLPRVGMEVLIDHIGGDPDRMVVIGALANGPNTPASFTHTGALPGNRYVSGVKTKEIKGARYNQLRLDDTPQQISAQLASEHAHSQLNLGYLTQPRDNGQGADRGEGVELRTDAAAALRAAQGMLLTTYARTQASGGQLDRDELVQLLGECTELFKSLGDYAGQHGGQPTDATGQQAVASAFKGWKPGDDPAKAGTGVASASQALMAFGAQAGSVNLTPKTHVTYAGENIDQVAQQHVQLVSGQRLTASAGQGVNIFGRGEGVHAVAGDGPMVLQAQQDTLTVTAQKGINISSIGDAVIVSGKTIRLVAEDGSYVQIGGGIQVGSNGAFTAHTGGHDFLDPATQHVAPPAFSTAGADQKFRLRYPGTDGDNEAHPAPNRPYAITLSDGREIKGTSDSGGLTDLLSSDAMHIAHIKVFDPQE
jgi:type VI secretion system secreted protein VgrG